MTYIFNENEVFETIKSDWLDFAEAVGTNKFILGISGGIDSTTVATLACKIFGKDNVYGLSMPCDYQADMNDVNEVFKFLGIKRFDFDIGDANYSVVTGIENNGIEVSNLTKTNLPARLRMASVYAFAQSLNAIVLNTGNLSESLASYDTLFGDDCGSYAPIQRLTKTEIRKLATYLGVPHFLVNKTPIDGLQNKSDEENFGYTYEAMDKYIRTGIGEKDIIDKIIRRYETGGKWKMKMVTISGPEFDFPNYVTEIR